jgi:HK97 gp10 family phage protein
MATGARFALHMTGFEELLSAIKHWPRRVQMDVVKPAVRAGERVIRAEAKKNLALTTGGGRHPTHRGPDYKPGTLQKSFTRREHHYRGKVFVITTGPSWKRAGYHAHLVEKGTGERRHKTTGASCGSMPAFSYMLDAYISHGDRAQIVMMEKMLDGIRHVWWKYVGP